MATKTTTVQLNELWNELRQTPGPEETGFVLRLCESTNACRIFAAYGGIPRLPALVVEFPEEARKRLPPKLATRAFTVVTADFPGIPPGRLCVLTALVDGDYEDLFAILGEDVRQAVAAADSEAAAATALRDVIDRWRRFVERRSAPLTTERARGLIGELVVLARLVGHLGGREALTDWTGPHDAIHDFELPDSSVEVKAFQGDRGRSIRISDPAQLDFVAGRPVFVVTVQLARTQKGRTLPDYVRSLRELLMATPGGVEILEHKLAEYGYLPAHASLYGDAYVVESLDSFHVAPAFPRIPPAAVPAGVHDVEYSITLAAIAPFEVDSVNLLGGQVLATEAPLQ